MIKYKNNYTLDKIEVFSSTVGYLRQKPGVNYCEPTRLCAADILNCSD